MTTPNDAREVVNYGILPYQNYILKNYKHEQMAIAGGLGSGKTQCAALFHILRAQLNIGCVSWWVAPDYGLARVGFDMLCQVLKTLGYSESAHFTARRSPGSLSLFLIFCDHEIRFKTTNQNLVGENISHMTVDEAGDCNGERIGDALQRVGRHPETKNDQVLFVGTPQGMNHYAERFTQPGMIEQGELGQFKVSDTRLVLHYQTQWNYKLLERVPRYIDRFLEEFGHDAAYTRAWMLGQFVALASSAVFKFDRNEHVKNAVLDVNLPLYIGWDFNVGQMSYILLQKQVDYSREETIWACCGESSQNLYNTEEAVTALVASLGQEWRGQEILIDGDANGWAGSSKSDFSDYDIIRDKMRAKFPRAKIIAPHHNSSVQMRAIATNRLFASKRLCISPKCNYLIDSLERSNWDNYKNVYKPSGDTWTHRAEAMSYVVSRQEPVSKTGILGGFNW